MIRWIIFRRQLTGAVSSGNSASAHLHTCDTALVFLSRAPVDEIEAFRKRIGWQMPWFSTMDDFNADFEVLRAISASMPSIATAAISTAHIFRHRTRG